MGQGGEQVIHWETKEKILGLIQDVDRFHTIKRPSEVADIAFYYDGKTINDLCIAADCFASSILYQQWRAEFLNFGNTKEEEDRVELDKEVYFLFNYIICNSEK